LLRRLSERAGRGLHLLFDASVVIKAVLATWDALAGIGLLLAPNTTIQPLVDWRTRHEIAHEQTDPMSTRALSAAQGPSALDAVMALLVWRKWHPWLPAAPASARA
jgi:uncharacterized membrane protein